MKVGEKKEGAEKPLPSNPKRIVKWLSGLFMAVIVIYIGFWAILAQLLEDGFKSWVDSERALGREFTFLTQETSGFWPRLTIYGPQFKVGDNEVQGSKASIVWQELSKVHIFLEGEYSLIYKGRDRQFNAVLKPERAWIETPLQPNSALTEINLKKAKFVDNNGFTWGVDSLRLGLDPRDSNHPRADIEAYSLSIPTEYKPLISPNIETIYLKASLSNPWPGNLPLEPALKQWSQNGGAVELEEGEINWDPIKSRMNATLVFDKRMQPILSAVIATSGLGELFDILVRRGLMKQRDAAIAKLGLSFLSKPGKEGDAFEQKISLTLQDNVLSLGPVKLLKVPDFKWYWEEEAQPEKE